MALSNAEKQQAYRARLREKREAAQRAVAVIPLAEHEEKLARYKARVEDWRDQQAAARQLLAAELEEALDTIARLEAELTSSSSRCPRHQTALECRECSRGEDY